MLFNPWNIVILEDVKISKELTMHLASIPTYSDLFDDSQPKIQDLLRDIPTRLVIAVACAINAELHLGEGKEATDKRIVEFLLQRQPLRHKVDLYHRFAALKRVDKASGLFATNYVVRLMDYCFRNYIDFEIEDTSPLQELNIFKAYLILANESNKADDTFYERNRKYEGEFFHQFTWPLMAEQFQTNEKTNPISEMVRGLVFLNYFQRHPTYQKYLKKFLEVNQRSSPWHYIIDYLNVIQVSWRAPDNGILSGSRYKLALIENHQPLFEKLCLGPQEYCKIDHSITTHFSSIKAKPLFKYEGEYFVLDWNALAGKLYEGLIFDFFNLSGISQDPKIKDIGGMKRLIGPEITERFLFQRLLGALFDNKYSVLKFDNGQIEGFPDGYYRRGNNLVLFEIKDAFFPAKAIASKDYLTIQTAIDEKYNQSDKGTGQFIKQLSLLINGKLEVPQDFKIRNLRIYTIIICTDHMFCMPGINDYLQLEFYKKINQTQLRESFKQIRPLTAIDIRFFIDNISTLKDKDMDLFGLLDNYQNYLERARKKARRSGDDLSAFFETYQTFEHATRLTFPEKFAKRPEYVTQIVEALDLTEGLPKADQN
jgi:hypothetical protein